MAMIKQAPPWITYVSELEQLFKLDDEVHVVYDNDEHNVKLYVENAEKATALMNLIPEKKEFGNVTLTIEVVPANGYERFNVDNEYQAALNGNGAFSFIKVVSGVFTNNITYVVFKNRVVQYFDDNLGDIYGQRSTLYQEIAKNIFGETEGVFFCTDVPASVREAGRVPANL